MTACRRNCSTRGIFWYVSGQHYLGDLVIRHRLSRVLLTCDTGNEASRRVILTNGGVADGRASNGDLRFWITGDGG